MKTKALTPVIIGILTLLSVAPQSLSKVATSPEVIKTQERGPSAAAKQSPSIYIAQAGSFSDFLLKLGQRETGQQNPPHNIENPLGFIGKYQFGEALLIDLGYYQADVYYNGGSNGVSRNNWQGRWTGKNGINSKEDFLNNTNNVQEIAIEEAFNLFWGRITSELSIGDYLGGSVDGVPITCSGILAAAHLRGEYGVINLLRNGYESHDEYNTSILAYLDEFKGYQTPYCQ